MKKIISLALVLALVLAVSATAFATSTTETQSGNSHEILASYEEGTQDKTVISVDISWEQMFFTYKGASAPVWNAEEHRYEGEATEAGWAESNATITINNHSNTILQAQIEYKADTAYSGISMHFTDTAPYIGSAYTDDSQDEEGVVTGTPCAITIQAIPSGELAAETEDNTRIGVITITVNSNIDPLEVADAISAQVFDLSTKDPETLSRGGVYLAEETDRTALQLLIDEAMEICATPDKTTVEKNVALNKMLTAFYGALAIVQ